MRVRFISLIIAVIAWWFVSLFTSDLVMPSPAMIVNTFLELMNSGSLPDALATSLKSLIYGGTLSLVIGIPVGILMGVWRPLADMLEYYVAALYVIPMSAVVPLMVLWFGFDLNVQVLFILIFTIPQVVITCYQGAKNVPDSMIEVARAFRANQRDIFFKVTIPYVIPFIITALRLGIGRDVQGMVVADLLLGGTKGLVILIHLYSDSIEIANVLAIVLCIILLGIMATSVVRWFENALAPWQKGIVAGSGE
jgi:NitT/TauT family transport system permease protein